MSRLAPSHPHHDTRSSCCEQAKGKAVDKRADIWAFGVVLYEMLTGQRRFSAETIPETLAHVMTREIDLGALPATTPRHIRTLLARCLVKEPKQRLRDIGEARLALDGAFESATPQTTTAATPASPRRTIAIASATLLAGAVVATLALGADASHPRAAAADALRLRPHGRAGAR